MLREEIGDIYLYLLLLASKFNVDIEDASKEKLKINIQKHPARKVRGLSKLKII